MAAVSSYEKKRKGQGKWFLRNSKSKPLNLGMSKKAKVPSKASPITKEDAYSGPFQTAVICSAAQRSSKNKPFLAAL